MKSIPSIPSPETQTLDNLRDWSVSYRGGDIFLRMREWEMESMKALTEHLEVHIPQILLSSFFLFFQIPKLGKEFDLSKSKKTDRKYRVKKWCSIR